MKANDELLRNVITDKDGERKSRSASPNGRQTKL